MKIMRNFFALIRKRKLDADMAEEMQHHIELQTELNVKAGMNPNEARCAVLRQFGNVMSIQEQAREVRGWVKLEQFGKTFCLPDVRLAALVGVRSRCSPRRLLALA